MEGTGNYPHMEWGSCGTGCDVKEELRQLVWLRHGSGPLMSCMPGEETSVCGEATRVGLESCCGSAWLWCPTEDG